MEGDEFDAPMTSRPTIPIGGVFPGTSPSMRQRALTIDEEEEEVAAEARDEQIRPRATQAEWDFTELLKDNVDVASCKLCVGLD